MRCIYPAVFTGDEESKTYLVHFPDMENGFTFGYTLTEAVDYAADVLNLML